MKYLYVLFFLFPITLLAQQLPNITAFPSGRFAWNPAMTAPWEYIESQAIYQQEWLGFEGAPQTLSASIQVPLLDQKMSLGAQLSQDRVGPLKQSTISLMYAYQISLSYHNRLAIGAVVNASQFRFDGSNLLAFDLDDSSLGMDDSRESQFNVGLGLFYTSVNTEENDESHLFAGLSVLQALPGDLYFEEESAPANLKRDLHAYGQIGYRFIQENGFVEPSLQILYASPNIAHVQLEIKYEILNAFWTGLSLDSSFRAGFQLGFILPNIGDGSFRIGSMASYNLSSAGSEQGMSFQALIGYRYEL
ncbi:MAG: type IX secretion system PorP/SprF family membrane protein [Polaribacter sp.]|jgi:type IX secretion system PorP/SprF family membrane protein